MAWIDADPETVRRECAPKEVQEAFEKKWERDRHKDDRIRELEIKIEKLLELVNYILQAWQGSIKATGPELEAWIKEGKRLLAEDK